jgi:hypothetical protein
LMEFLFWMNFSFLNLIQVFVWVKVLFVVEFVRLKVTGR